MEDGSQASLHAEGLGGRGRQNRAFISKQNRAVANVSALFVTLRVHLMVAHLGNLAENELY